MQHILDFTKENKKYISKPFDFEALCLVNDAHISGAEKGPVRICSGAVDYMFEGTEATQEIIDGLDLSTRVELCMRIWSFYAEALNSKKK